MLRSPETAAGDLLDASLGTLWYYSGTTDPINGLICDGRIIKYSDYPELTEFLNTVKQTGDPRKDIIIPDLRGCFLRGLGGKSGRLMEIQDFAMQNITGKFNGNVNDGNYFGGAFYSPRNNWETRGSDGGNGMGGYIYFDASRQVQTADETRPRNMAFNIVIGTGRLGKKKKKLGQLLDFLINSSLKYLLEVR